MVGFSCRSAETVIFEGRQHHVIGMAARYDEAGIGIELENMPRHLSSAYPPWYCKVQNRRQVWRARMVGCSVQRGSLFAAGARGHPVSLLLQHRVRKRPDQLLIVHHQYRPAVTGLAGRDLFDQLLIRLRIPGDGEVQDEGRALAQRGIKGYPTAMPGYYRVNRGKP